MKVELLSTIELNSKPGKRLVVHRFGVLDYPSTLLKMQQFAANRKADEPDQIWLLEHAAVYTQGTACEQETLIPSDIAVVKTDRGGQITYHGPGQIVLYPLLRLKDYGLGIKDFVYLLEQTVIDTLGEFDLIGERRNDAPGVYVQQAKIAALGLRIRRGTSYHGLSLNIDMNLSPFSNIDPCGYKGLQVTQLSSLVPHSSASELNSVREMLLQNFVRLLD